MPEGVAIGVLLCALVVGVAVETLIGAVILRAAIALYNKMAGGVSSPGSVPEPALGKAMWITFAICMAQILLGAAIVFATWPGASAPGARGEAFDLVLQLVSFPASFLIMAGMLSARLPTTFARAILVTLCYVLLALLFAGVLVAIGVLVFAVALRGN